MVQRNVRSASQAIEVTVDWARTDVYSYFISIELSDILVGWGPLPGVVSVSDRSGTWESVGSVCTTHFADGSVAREHVTAYNPPEYSSFLVTDFTHGLLRRLATEAVGEWWFEEQGDDATLIRWQFTFHARNALTLVILKPFVALLWKQYMRRALKKFKELCEAHVTPS